jgi:hypothetical protein
MVKFNSILYQLYIKLIYKEFALRCCVFTKEANTFKSVYLGMTIGTYNDKTLFDKVHLKVSVVIYRKALGIDFFRICMNACRIRCMFSSEIWKGPRLFLLHGHPVGSN